MKHSIIFIGLLDKVATNGETMKNQLFVNRFEEIFDKVYVFNAKNVKHRPCKLIKLLILCWAHPQSKIYLSASWGIAKPLIYFLKLIGRNNIYYWVVGGIFHELIKSGKLPKYLYKSIKSIIVQNEYMKDSLLEQGFTNVHFISNSKRIDFLPKIPFKNNATIRFVFLSRIHPTKGCEEIISSVIKLNTDGYEKKVSVDFYGKIDECYTNFLSEIEHVPNINYKGFLDLTSTDGYNILSQYDVMLFPTYWVGEGFPGVIIDAYIAGLPVLASDWNLNKYYITNETGIMIPHHNQQKLEIEMLKLIKGEYDINAMSKKSQGKAMKYDNRLVLTVQSLNQIGAY